VQKVALDDHVGEGRVVGLLARIELEGGALVAPDPARVAMAEVGDDVGRDHRSAVGVGRLRLVRLAGMGGGAGHESDGPERVLHELVARDEHIAGTVHRLHPHEAVRDDVVGQDHVVGMQVDALRGVLDVVAQDTREIAGLGRGHDDTGALLPVVSVARVPRRLAEEGALRRILLRPDAELMLLLRLLRRPEHLFDDRIPFDERPLAGGDLDARAVGAVEGVAPFRAPGAVIDGDPHVITDEAARDAGEAAFAKG